MIEQDEGPVLPAQASLDRRRHDEVDPLRDRLRQNGLPCPHCGSPTRVRSSKLVTPTFREIYCVCLNLPCSHAFKATLSYEYGISPSGVPDPDVDLPMRTLERVPGETIALGTGPPPDDPRQPRFFD